jgi:prepilin-type N-terminal cleavage/methylation domain-containing protein
MKRMQPGFTVIELLVVLTVMAILLGIATPRYVVHVDRARETALRHNLKAMREAVDQFHADRGAAPQSLADLVQARYLREVPEDPVTERRDTWVFAVAQVAALPLAGGPATLARATVHSGATGVAKDGTPYAAW